MQKKLIAIAVAGLVSGAAFADTSVTLGGKFDACYDFSRTARADVNGGAQGATTTETQADGCNLASRVTIGAREDLSPGYSVRVDYDLRFGSNVTEGKSGLNANDKKALTLATPFGSLQWGVANLESYNFHLAEKPFMVSPNDSNLVKWGISQLREDSLTSRNTSFWTPALTVGPVKTLLKGSYAFGDQRKSGSSNIDGKGSGDVFVVGNEGVLMDGLLDWGLDYTRRASSNSSSYAPNLSTSGTATYTPGGMIYTHYFVNVRPLPGNKNLKLSAEISNYRGYNGYEAGGTFKEKNTNFVVSYNFNGKAEVGLEVSHLNDMAGSRNSGRGITLGGSYFLSKTVQVYGAISKNDFDSNQGTISGGKYVGTNANFSGDISKLDSRTVRIGILKDF